MANLTRKSNAFLSILYLIISFGLFLFVVLFGRMFSGSYADMLFYLLGALIAVLINAFIHELGHYLAGKKHGYYLLQFQVLFFCFYRVNDKLKFSFKFNIEEAGKTVMVPTKSCDIKSSVHAMTKGGLKASFIMFIVGLIPVVLAFIIPEKIPATLYYISSMFLPVGAYFFFGNALPIFNGGNRNDGAVLSSLKSNDDTSKIIVNLYSIYSELYNGKSPKEIDKGLYFDLPVLREDDGLFAIILDARYTYFLDSGDLKQAKNCLDRLNQIKDYLSANQVLTIKAEMLYKACTFDYNENDADDYMSELEKYLNNNNDCLSLRAKTAYLKNVLKEEECLEQFFDKWEREIEKLPLKGLKKYELSLLNSFRNQ